MKYLTVGLHVLLTYVSMVLWPGELALFVPAHLRHGLSGTARHGGYMVEMVSRPTGVRVAIPDGSSWPEEILRL